MIACHLPAISSSAAAQEIGANFPSPLAPTRRSGVARRSGECTSSWSRFTLAQANPAVNGWSGSPLMRLTRPSSTSASSEHMSGQSWAQTIWMVSMPPLYGSGYHPPTSRRRPPMPDLLEAKENGVAWLTLNRPERLNALTSEMTQGLSEKLQRLATDREVGCIVVTGAGRGWCSGGDVKSMESRGRDQSVEDRVEGLRRAHQLPLLMRNCPKPIVAAINGPVAGAGLGLALACDLRVAGKAARFGTAFVRIGYSGDYGGSWSLTRLVGTAKAREMYLLGDVIDGDAAFGLGIVNQLVDDEKLRDATMTLARRIADGPRIALGYMKKNLLAAETEPFQTVLELEAEHQARCAFTDDHKEAVAAFVEKRRPGFKGQ